MKKILLRNSWAVDLLVESFKNYHYNNGIVSVDFEDGSVILKTELEGETGKRDFSVVLHDVNIERKVQ